MYTVPIENKTIITIIMVLIGQGCMYTNERSSEMDDSRKAVRGAKSLYKTQHYYPIIRYDNLRTKISIMSIFLGTVLAYTTWTVLDSFQNYQHHHKTLCFEIVNRK